MRCNCALSQCGAYLWRQRVSYIRRGLQASPRHQVTVTVADHKISLLKARWYCSHDAAVLLLFWNGIHLDITQPRSQSKPLGPVSVLVPESALGAFDGVLSCFSEHHLLQAFCRLILATESPCFWHWGYKGPKARRKTSFRTTVEVCTLLC